ncbi:hypothetical protein [Vulgatibacter incomptus]|nr:hypothetical protein [Vulgatibacter incomptus]
MSPAELEPAKAPTELVATENRPDAVHLEWKAPTGARAISIERDGVEIARFSGAAESYDDVEAEAGTASAPEVGATENREDAVLVSWPAARVAPGAEHRYAAIAHFDHGRSARSTDATGRRGSPGVVAVELVRDGALLAELSGVELAYLDEDASPGTIDPPMLSVAESPLAVSLTWQAPEARAGVTHSYSVFVVLADGRRVSAAAVTGRRAAPRIDNFGILRDGEAGPRLDPSTRTFDDFDAHAAELSETPFLAGQGTSAHGVELSWGVPLVTLRPHTYEIVAALDDGSSISSNAVQGARAAPVITEYRLTPLAGTAISFAPTTRSFTDTTAAPGTLETGSLQASLDQQAFVRLSWTEPAATRGPDSHYSLTEVFESGGERISFATGHRGPPGLARFEVYRDGAAIDLAVSSAARSFDDAGATAPNAIAATDLAAFSSATSVALSWFLGDKAQGTAHTYEVVAVASDGQDGSPIWAVGNRSMPLIRTAVLRDGVEILVDPALPVVDTNVERGTVEAPSIAASQDRLRDVRLDWTDPVITPSRRYNYEVVSTYADGSTATSVSIEAGAADPILIDLQIHRDDEPYWFAYGAGSLDIPSAGGQRRLPSPRRTERSTRVST